MSESSSASPGLPRAAIILAGGAGERFWPLSRLRKPKQLLSICGSQSMLLDSLERAAPVIAPENTYIVTGAELHAAVVAEVAGRIPEANVIAEPARRNTAAALALAAAHLLARFQHCDCATAVLTADHAINNADAFAADLESALDLAAESRRLVTFGIPPTRPETGFGYVEIGEPLAPGSRAHNAASFREKPSPDTAREFLETGRFLWNSGMFAWRNHALIDEMRAHLPRTAAAIPAMAAAITANDAEALAGAFLQTDALSIDYGVLERSQQVAVIPARFDWDDVGTWSAVARLFPRDQRGNAVHGRAVAIDCAESLLYCHHSAMNGMAAQGMAMTPPDGAVAPDGPPRSRPRIVVGFKLDRIAVVETDDAIMILPIDAVQNVREVVAHLRDSGLEEYL